MILEALDHRTPITANHLNSLIALLNHADASRPTTKILMKAIEQNAPINSSHLGLLIQTLPRANPLTQQLSFLRPLNPELNLGLKSG